MSYSRIQVTRIHGRALLSVKAVLDAEVRIGELTAAIPKVSGGDRRSEDFKKDTAVHFEKPPAPVTPKPQPIPAPATC